MRAAADVETGVVEAKFTPEYTASIDPFAAWRAKERERGRASMGVHDRMMFAAGQMIATNKCGQRLYAPPCGRKYGSNSQKISPHLDQS